MIAASIYTCKHSKCFHKLNLLTQSDSAYLQVSPVIFNFWFAAGIVISSLVLLVKYPLVSLAAVQPLPCVLHDRILHLAPFISSAFIPLTAACSINLPHATHALLSNHFCLPN